MISRLCFEGFISKRGFALKPFQLRNQFNTKEEQTMRNIGKLLRSKKGQTMVEYGLLIALVSIAVIAVLVLIGPNLAAFFTAVNDQLVANAPPAP
jgi:pilus assembly protein Flp/PilA